MRIALPVALCCLCLPALAETDATAPERPGDPHGVAPVWDSMAECGAILAAASSRSSSLIDRNRLKMAAGGWFAATFEQAAQSGDSVSPEQLGDYVTGWAGQIGSLSALASKPEWMTFCAHIGGQHGLDAQAFRENMPSEEVAEDLETEVGEG